MLPVELTRSLTVTEREKIERRLAEIDGHLSARDPAALRRIIAGMMLSIPSGRASGDEAAAIVAAYVNAVSDLPPWAVTAAANRFIRGQVKSANPAFPPSGAELHVEADKELVPLRAEKMRLERMLTAVVANRKIPPNDRNRQAVIENQAKAIAARVGLSARAAEMGVDLATIPNAPPSSDGTLSKLNGKGM